MCYPGNRRSGFGNRSRLNRIDHVVNGKPTHSEEEIQADRDGQARARRSPAIAEEDEQADGDEEQEHRQDNAVHDQHEAGRSIVTQEEQDHRTECDGNRGKEKDPLLSQFHGCRKQRHIEIENKNKPANLSPFQQGSEQKKQQDRDQQELRSSLPVKRTLFLKIARETSYAIRAPRKRFGFRLWKQINQARQ